MQLIQDEAQIAMRDANAALVGVAEVRADMGQAVIQQAPSFPGNGTELDRDFSETVPIFLSCKNYFIGPPFEYDVFLDEANQTPFLGAGITYTGAATAVTPATKGVGRYLFTTPALAEPHVVMVDELGGTGAAITFPWQCRYDSGLSMFSVLVGRVYEYNTVPIESVGATASNFSFVECTEPYGMMPGDVIYLPPPVSDDYISIVVEKGSDATTRDYYVTLESTRGGSTAVVQRLAKVVGTSVEQIHMGDVTFTQERLNAFKLAYSVYDTGTVMYVPSGSVVINGKSLTPSGLDASGVLSDWYVVSTALTLYIELGATSDTAGEAQAAAFDTTSPFGSGVEVLEIPILAEGDCGLVSVQYGAINQEIWRPDDSLQFSSSGQPSHKSMEALSLTGNARKLQLKNFVSAAGPVDPTIDDDDYTHHFAIRENDGNGLTTLTWWAFENLASAIENEVTEQLALIDWVTLFGDYWETWYDDTYPDGRFWELGEDESLCYGSAIGNNDKEKVIDLDAQVLSNGISLLPWNCAADFLPLSNTTYDLGSPNYVWAEGYISDAYIGELFGEIDDIYIRDNIASPFQHLIGTAMYPVGGVQIVLDGSVKVNDIKVLTNQQAAVADATSTSDVVGQLNDLLGKLRTHGLIAT